MRILVCYVWLRRGGGLGWGGVRVGVRKVCWGVWWCTRWLVRISRRGWIVSCEAALLFSGAPRTLFKSKPVPSQTIYTNPSPGLSYTNTNTILLFYYPKGKFLLKLFINQNKTSQTPNNSFIIIIKQ